ncbi:CD109 antigen-like [Spea bombifrons]|uniref:CD109 antigen-like n=1 Tax=Spea bombifrons TaxID=233779 RepID=UPI0023497A3A|nr:CD109 antigen-like [Spea bombifrons]
MHLPRSLLVRNTVLMISIFFISGTQQFNYVKTPFYIYPGLNTTIAVHLFGTNYPEVNVTAEVVHDDRVLVNASKVFYNDSIGLLTLPALPMNTSSSIYDMVVTGSFQDSLVFSHKSSLQTQTLNMCFIQTDKDVYNPGNAVKIRVISVDYHLRPFNGQVDLVIMDPKNNPVQKWLKLDTDRGIVSTEFFLSDNAMAGLWTIQTTISVSTPSFNNVYCFSLFNQIELNRNLVTNAQFEVLGQVEPEFSVTLNVPSFYIESKKLNLTGAVSARSIFGKPLTGNVTVYLSPYFDYLPAKGFNKTYKMKLGSVHFSFTSEEVLTLSNMRVIIITALVTEELTGIITKASSNIQIVNSEYRFAITRKPITFENETYFNTEIQLLRLDDAPLVKEERDKNITVTVIQTSDDNYLPTSSNNLKDNVNVHTSHSLTVQQYRIPESGVINVKFPLIDHFPITVLEAQYQNISQKWKKLNNHIGDLLIQLTIPDSMKTVGEAFEVHVSSYLVFQELYYVVMAKGMIVSTGRTTNTSFTLTPEHSWVPYASVNVHILNNNGINVGIVHASSDVFYIKAAPMKKVSLLWNKNKVKPSENISLTVTVAEPQSWMGLCVVEKQDNPANRNGLTMKRVETELTRYIQNKTISEWSSFFREPRMGIRTLPTSYPETWLWLDNNNISGVTTTLKVTAPQKNTTWVASGFAISERLGLQLIEEPIQLEVIQSFFISLNLPYSVIMGEQLVLEATLFNYLAENQEVTVTLEDNDSFEIIALNYDASTVAGQRKVTVPSQDTKNVLFPVKPKQLGQISFTVKATSSAASDSVTKNIFVKAEGVKQFYSESVLFRLAATESSPKAMSKNLSFTFPSDVVQGSKEAFVTAVGDLLGPSIESLESLIQMPYGCGEQNMINFAPNIYVLQYLMATKQITENIRERAIIHMLLGYQKELTFRRDDGSFSAFGNNDASGSSWLSAFVLRCFLQARPFIYISPDILTQTVEWLVQYQDMNTGVFSEPGRVIHSELQGGLNGPITLTAYILTSLIEDEGYRNQHSSRVLKAVQYLENEFDKGISSNYTLSVVAYALSLANSTKANASLTQLSLRANNIGGLKYWSSPAEHNGQTSSSDIETAAYALLSHHRQNRISEGIPIMRWLSQQRTSFGGYYSTQDTIVALQALSQFMVAVQTMETSLTITITGPGSFVPKTFQINSGNILLLQSQQIAVSQPLTINVTAAGRGLVIFQLNVNYNQRVSSARKRRALSSEAFKLDVIVNEDKNNIYRLYVNICTSYQGLGNESGMALLDFGFLSGFTLDPAGILLQGSLKLVEKKDDKVYLYYDSVTKTQLCVSIPMIRVAYVASSKDAVVKIVDYYNPTNTATRSYNSLMMKRVSFCDFCGLNCTLCKSNVLVKPQHSNANSLSFHFFLFFILSIYNILLHSSY